MSEEEINETQTGEEQQEEQSEESSESSPVDEAKQVLSEIKEQNKILAKNLQRAEKLVADNMIAGKSFAGGVAKPPEESDQDYAKRVMRGDF